MRREPHDSYEHERRQTAALERIVQLLERLVPVDPDTYPDCGHERRPGTWGHNGECLTCHGITGGFGMLNMDGTVTPIPFTVTPVSQGEQ